MGARIGNHMKLTLNKEFFRRRLGVVLLMAALGCWFSYDAAVAYPAKREPADKIARQWQFAGISFLAAFVLGGCLLKVRRETLAWDDIAMTGSLTGGKPAAFADVKSVDGRKWREKGILVVTMADGRVFKLDAWHHPEVEALAKKLKVEC